MKHEPNGTNPSHVQGVQWSRVARRFGPPALGLAVAIGVLASVPSARHADAAKVAPSTVAQVKTADSRAGEGADTLAMGGRCVVACAPSVTTSNDPNQCGAVVNYGAPTTQGDCSTITCSPPSGSFFPVGTTTVTCTDFGGATCTMQINVVDTQPPTITCAPNQFGVTAGPGVASGVVVFPPPTASDNCPGVTAACNPPSGSSFPIGTTTVTCTATDASGNTATCTFTVTVFDVCVQDDSSATKVLKWNSTTGDYLFCCNGVVYSGKGTATKQGSIYNLVHNPIDRRVLGRVDATQKRGTGSIQSPPGQNPCTIMDRDTRNNTCVCP